MVRETTGYRATCVEITMSWASVRRGADTHPPSLHWDPSPTTSVTRRSTLLAFGGSQGARTLNRALVAALPRLAAPPRPRRGFGGVVRRAFATSTRSFHAF